MFDIGCALHDLCSRTTGHSTLCAVITVLRTVAQAEPRCTSRHVGGLCRTGT